MKNNRSWNLPLPENQNQSQKLVNFQKLFISSQIDVQERTNSCNIFWSLKNTLHVCKVFMHLVWKIRFLRKVTSTRSTWKEQYIYKTQSHNKKTENLKDYNTLKNYLNYKVIQENHGTTSFSCWFLVKIPKSHVRFIHFRNTFNKAKDDQREIQITHWTENFLAQHQNQTRNWIIFTRNYQKP